MNEISSELKAVEKSANKSSTYVRQLNEILLKHRDKDLKNMTVSRPVLWLEIFVVGIFRENYSIC